MRKEKIPAATIIRLSVYQRYLKRLLAKGVKVVSSSELAYEANVNPAQLRKDLSYFGRFGVRGVGYDVASLLNTISGILGLLDEWRVVLVGAGPIGQALLRHPQFSRQGYVFEAVFDFDPTHIGRELEGGLVVQDLRNLPRVIQEKDIQLAVLAVPSEKAQEIADLLVDCGIKGILNFCTTRIRVPRGVSVQYVDFTILLDTLTYKISQSNTEGMDEHVKAGKPKWAREHSWPVVQSNVQKQGVTLTS
ncbi:MAG: redox-sensing transcriptional repressor Rex [Thermodesulfobacteria bacterium]|nr:redox-sensing transcriptional repressor Rex [Thermodesulfobacteriota bacterium]